MSLNSDYNPSWGEDTNKANAQAGGEAPASNAAFTAGTVQSGLAGLFSLASMTSDSRNLNIVGDVLKELTEIYERLKTSTTNELQRKTIPDLKTLTSSISATLPGLGFSCKIGDTLYVMATLFSTGELNISSERITINNPGGFGQSQVSIPLSPVQYTNQQFYEALKSHYQREAETQGIKNVAVINMLVQDMDMLHHPEAGDTKEWPRNVANFLASEWDEALLVKSVQEIAAAANMKTPNPFQNPQQPYGKDGCAEARVTAISGRVTKGKTLTAANMEVIASTINNNQSGNNAYQGNSKEIARVQATVSLNGVSWEEYSRFYMSHQSPEKIAQLQAFLGAGMGQAVYANGYRPLRPVITMDAVQAGEMLGYNGGLYPYFYALYLLMATNANFVWSEALRKHSVGSRGNLSAMEIRLQHLLTQVPGGLQAQRIVLDDKKISDTDLVNQWIRQNVSPHATFQVNLLQSGPHASIHNFLLLLAKKDNAAQVKTVVAIIDAMTNNKMSAIIARNAEPGKNGWTPKDPVLMPTGMIAVNGLAEAAGKKLNTQELDEMMISNIKGKNGLPAIESYLSTIYGSNPQEDFKQRCQKLRVELHSSIFDGAVHINGFAQPHIWAPGFMAALGEAMDGIGQLNVANNIGSFRTTGLVFAPGVGLATMAAAGSNNPTGANLGMGYNMGVPFL